MSEKVVITKAQAKELLNLGNWSNREILKVHSNDNYGWDRYKGLNGMDFDKLVNALYNGYEVEREPEELVLELYEHEKEGHNVEAYVAIESTLKLLEIEIEGINK